MDVIGEPGRRLHLAADQQRVLVGDQELPVVRNSGPSAAFHEGVMARDAAHAAFVHNALHFGRPHPAAIIFLERWQRARLALDRMACPPVNPAMRHADQAGDHAAVEAVARLFGDAPFLFHPARAAPGHVRPLQVLAVERAISALQQLHHRFGQLRTRWSRPRPRRSR